jgi:HD domain
MCALCLDLNNLPNPLLRPGFLPNPTLLHSLGLLRRIAEILRSMTQPQAGIVIAKPLLAIPSEILNIRIPDSDVSVAAAALAQSAMPSVLFNHCLRTFLLGMIDARKRTLQIDEEAAFVSSILHDLALLAKYSRDVLKSFEENGAEFARAFSLDRGFSANRADKVAEAIRLHAGQADGMGPDIEFVMVGAAQDVFGPSQEQLSDDQVAAMEQAVPRLGFKAKFLSVLTEHVKRTKNPTWTAGFVSDPPAKFLNNRWSE